MSETMIKKQFENSDIQTGACRFCGQIYQFETDGRVTEEQLDDWAVEKCDCVDAQIYRKRSERADEAKDCIEDLIGEKYPEISETLKRSIDMILEQKITKISVDTGKGKKMSVMVNAKGIIKVEISKTEKKSTEV